MKRSDIGEGYILVSEYGTKFRVVRYVNKLFLMNMSLYVLTDNSLNDIMDNDLNPKPSFTKFIEIKNVRGETLWKKPRELTMQEIADKFGIPVEQLKIKK